VGPVQATPLLHALRQQMLTASQGSGRVGATQMKSVIIARYLGNSSEVARHVMLAAWQLLRPALLGHEASVPRIWKT
jgi:urease accessory protein